MPPAGRRARSAAGRYLPPLVACATLGLAPFVPEPHILGKLRWLLGGVADMRPVDAFDLVFHAAPWLWLMAVMVDHLLGVARGAGRRAEPSRRRVAALAAGIAIAGAALCVAWARLGPGGAAR